MLIPMPPLWLADAALIAADRFRMPELGFVNVLWGARSRPGSLTSDVGGRGGDASAGSCPG
jgi:hypothetical protein